MSWRLISEFKSKDASSIVPGPSVSITSMIIYYSLSRRLQMSVFVLQELMFGCVISVRPFKRPWRVLRWNWMERLIPSRPFETWMATQLVRTKSMLENRFQSSREDVKSLSRWKKERSTPLKLLDLLAEVMSLKIWNVVITWKTLMHPISLSEWIAPRSYSLTLTKPLEPWPFVAVGWS